MSYASPGHTWGVSTASAVPHGSARRRLCAIVPHVRGPGQCPYSTRAALTNSRGASLLRTATSSGCVEADDGPGVHSRYLLDGCGEHTLNINIANNIQVTGTVTLDGSPYVGQIGVAVGQMPPDLETHRIRSTGSNVAGEYAFSASFDPAYCDDLWVWLIGDTVDHLEKIPGCGPQGVDVDAVSL